MITDVTIADGAAVGPFAHLRNDAAIGRDARRQFRRAEKDRAWRRLKAMHLAYLGDATIGAHQHRRRHNHATTTASRT